MLAAMVESEQVQVDHPVSRYLPDDIIVPRRGDREITLIELATHTSGLPRIAPNMNSDMTVWSLLSGKTGLEDPGAKYDLEQMKLGLAQIKLNDIETPDSDYSNLGTGLLGESLAHQAGTTYEGLVRRTITEPLMMPDTVQTPTESQRAKLATGHRGKSKAVGNWSFASLAGCGALFSTAEDLLNLLAAQCGLADSPLESAIQMTQKRWRHIAETMSIGLCWHILDFPDGQRIWFHDGGTNGYTSFVAFSRDPAVAVVVLCNTGVNLIGDTDRIDRLGIDILRELIIANR